jgi:hypothetical protein
MLYIRILIIKNELGRRYKRIKNELLIKKQIKKKTIISVNAKYYR